MKEPVYYCERCQKVLERKEQGKYTWCETCRNIWTDGFNTGCKAYSTIMNSGNCGDSIVDLLTNMDNWLPFKVKE